MLLKGATSEWILRTVSEEKCSIVWLLVPWAQDLLDAIDRKENFPHHQYDTNYGLPDKS